MKVAIVGAGVEGKAAYEYWKAQGAQELTFLDANVDCELPDGARGVLGPDYLDDLDQYDLIVRSPGTKPWLLKTTKPVTSGVREFLAKCPARIIGVTGTKGKGTTSTLISKILQEAGKRVWLGGNIGRPVLEFLPQVKPTDLVVLELSSFQLMDLERSPHIAVCLMIAPEHLDWHRDMREYVTAKGNIFWHQEAGDVAIYNAHNEFSTEIAQLSRGEKIPYLEAPGARVQDGRIMMGDVDICGTDEVGLLGPHNLENVCAAVTATWGLVGHKLAPIRRAVKAFTGLPHRIEWVREADGVQYVNDSFSSNPIATVAAVRSFAAPKVMILGGKSRGIAFDELAAAVAAADVRGIVLIGETAEAIGAALKRAGFNRYELGGTTMTAIVKQARSLAHEGDVVVLSPGCASFDMFRNFQDRGEQFRAAVEALS